jgi:hypothetical protein
MERRHLSDGDRGGSKGDKSSGPVGDVSSRQSCATNEAANSTLLTPLSGHYHKCAPTAMVPPTLFEGIVDGMRVLPALSVQSSVFASHTTRIQGFRG